MLPGEGVRIKCPLERYSGRRESDQRTRTSVFGETRQEDRDHAK